MNNLAMAYAMMGDAKKAEDILRQAVTTEGATPKVRENLALVLGLQGRYDESKAVAAGVLNSECRLSQRQLSEADGEARCRRAPCPMRKASRPRPKWRAPPRSTASGKQNGGERAPKPATTAALSATQDPWQTSVDGATSAIALKDTSRWRASEIDPCSNRRLAGAGWARERSLVSPEAV